MTAAPAATIGAVVVAYRSADTIAACVDSLLRDDRVRVVVVDNAADPATRRALESLPPWDSERLRYLDPGDNLGYARAANRGLALLGDLDVVAIVNPDVALTGTLSELAAHPEFGERDVIAGRLTSGRRDGGHNARPLASPGRELRKALVGSAAYRLDLPPGPAVHRVGQLDGALMLLGADTWRALGGFDEDFELYYEDVDLCARVAGGGGHCLLVDREWGHHLGGHSFDRSGGTGYVVQRVSRVRYARKHWGAAPVATAWATLITVTEFAVRSLSRQAEGQATRNRALTASLGEVRRAGSQRLLRPVADSAASGGSAKLTP